MSDTSSEAYVLAAEPPGQIQRSLFGEILDWMLVPLLLLWPMSIAITYLVAKSIANHPFDRALEDRVTVLAQQIKEQDGKLALALPATARDFVRADDVDLTYYQLLDQQGGLLDKFRRMRGAAQEREVGGDGEFGIPALESHGQ